MRMSDWSSDVCSSDLLVGVRLERMAYLASGEDLLAFRGVAVLGAPCRRKGKGHAQHDDRGDRETLHLGHPPLESRVAVLPGDCMDRAGSGQVPIPELRPKFNPKSKAG